MNWDEIVAKITPYIVKIETPQGHGTGFLCLYNDDRSMCGIATARHVVHHADEWQEPIRVLHQATGTVALLKESDRLIWDDEKVDSAVILGPVSKFKFPQDVIPMLPPDHRLPIGVEVGWLGYPAIGPRVLCFFSGNVSAVQESIHAYLIDGVAINGVSGGPVVYSTATDGVQIVGAISAYMVNRATGEALPGLSVAQDVSHFQNIATHVKSIDEAKKKKALEQSKLADAQPSEAKASRQ
jgi:trypsin-like peptidase